MISLVKAESARIRRRNSNRFDKDRVAFFVTRVERHDGNSGLGGRGCNGELLTSNKVDGEMRMRTDVVRAESMMSS